MRNKILIEKREGIGTITLNDPDRLNPLSNEMNKELLKALMELDLDENICVVLVAGKGRAFCAGGDIRSMGNKKSIIDNKETIERAAKIIHYMYHMKKPVITAVHGYAAGAGFSLALASDIIIADENTEFILSFKKVGLIPDLGLHYFLPRIVGPWKAKSLIWSAGKITAEEGLNYGFVTNVVEKGNAVNEAFEMAKELSNGPMQVFYHSKTMINSSSTMNLDKILDMESNIQTVLKETVDHAEGINAFREKRSPNFIGK